METGKLALTNGGFMVYNSLSYECGMANNNFNNNRSPNFTIWTLLGVTQKSYPCMNWESAHVWQIGK